MLTQLLTQPCTIVRRTASGTTDEYGNEVPGEELVETIGYLDQVRRAEPGGQGELSVTDWLLFLPAGTAIDTSDQVIVDNYVYEVIGDPAKRGNPRTAEAHHVEATLRRTGEEAGS